MMANFLIIEDDPVVRKLLEAALSSHGHSSIMANDSFDALEKINAELFDLIICDINLPVHNGFIAIQSIRKEKRFERIPVLFLSGRREKKDVEKAMEVGGDDYMMKPVDFDLFFAKVDALLNKKPQEHSFAEASVDEVAKFATEFKVIGVSEQGLTMKSLFPLPINFKLKISCPMFEEIGIEMPRQRVAVCTEDKGKNSYLIKTAFIGMTSGELQQIRRFTLTNHRSQKVS